MKKRVLSILLSVLMVITILPFNLFTASAKTVYETEDNDSVEKADSFSVGDTIKGSMLSCDDVDYYKFTVSKNGYVVFNFKNTILTDENAYWDVYVYKYANTLEEIHDQTVYGTHASTTFTKIGVTPGTYYIKIKDGNQYYGDVNNVEYNITVNFTATEYWESEGNDEYTTADEIVVGQKYGGYIRNSDCVDYYKFTVSKNGYIVFNFKNTILTDEAAYWDVYVYKYANTLEEIHDQTVYGTQGSTTSTKIGVTPGAYYIKIKDGNRYYGDVNNVEYNITINFTATEYWESEGNDEYTTADEIVVGQKYGGYIRNSDCIDYYKFELNKSGYIDLNFTNQLLSDSNANWNVTLYKIGNTLEEKYTLTASGLQTSSFSTSIGVTSGVYYIKIVDGNRYYGDVNDVEYGIKVDYVKDKSAPTLTSLANTVNGPQLKWSAKSGVTNYWVYRKTSGGSFSKIATTSSTSYIDSTAKSGTTYTYTVKANYGSYYSAHQSGKTLKCLSAPKISSVSRSGSNNVVKWGAVTGASGYYVYYKTSANGTWTKITSTSSTSYTHKNASSAYYYNVKAYSGSTTSSWNAGVKVTGVSLATPKISSITNSVDGPYMTWSKISGASGYNVYRKTSGGSWARIGQTTGTSYKDTTAKSGTTYYYTLRAYVGSTLSSYNTAGTAIKFLSAPKLSSIQNSVTGPYMTWNKITGASGYQVYRKTGANGTWTKIATTTSTNYRDTKASSGTTYYYTIKSYSGSTTSSMRAGTPLKFLSAPTISSVSSVSNGLKVSWGAVTGATQYQVWRRVANGTWYLQGTTTSTSFTDNEVKVGSTFYYSIKAVNGNTTSSMRGGVAGTKK